MSTHALASITATYTDSEPEGDDEDSFQQDESKKVVTDNEDSQKDEKESRSDSVLSNNNNNNASTNQEISQRVAKLVSYHDDTVVSDDDADMANQRLEDVPELKSSGITGDVELPAEPTGRCSPRLVEKVQKLHEKIANGLDMNDLIQSRKEFRNPSIYEKLIQFCGLNELGTNYPAGAYDPLIWGKESFYEELAKVQKVEMDRREKEKKERTKVEFVSGTKKPSGSTNDEEQKKRKSKWDQVGASATGGISLGLIRPAGLLQASLTSSVTGTKGTVISAFGSLPKKPRL